MPCVYVISKLRPRHQISATYALQSLAHTGCGLLAIVVEAKVPAVPLHPPTIVVTLDNA